MDRKEFERQANYRLRKIEKAEEQKIFSAERLRKAMKENGATKKDIVAEVHKHNIIPPASDTIETYIDRVVSGEMIPFLRTLKAICISVNVSADYLMGLSERMN